MEVITVYKTKANKNTVPINKNIPYYLVVTVIFILLKFGYTYAETDQLKFLLKPTNKLVEVLTGSHSVYDADTGYYHERLNIVIDGGCSGFNFWVLSFLLFAYMLLKYFDKALHKMVCIPAALVLAYLLTIFVNTSRIFASLVVHNQTENILRQQQYLVHEAVGIITNLSFLVLAYYLIEKFLTQKKHQKNHEKFT